MEQSKLLQEAWDKGNISPFIGILKNIKNENLNEALGVDDKENWKSALDSNQEKGKVLICADERVMPLPGEFKVGTAGQLIMESKEYIDDFVKSFKGKIKAVRSHSGCGAAGAVYSKLTEEEKQKFVVLMNELALEGVPTDEVSPGDLYGVYHSFDLAKKLDAKFEHTSFSKMRGYKEFHDSRIMFWSADPTFDPSNLTDKYFPPHFLSNGLAFDVNEDYSKEELKFLSSIALGEKGFGKLIDAGNPFYIISIGKNVEEAQKMNEWAKEIMKEFGDRVKYYYLSTQEIK